MSGVIVKEVPIAANATVDNIYAGSQFALLSVPSLLSIATTGNVTGLVVSHNIGNRIISEPSPPPVATVMPKVPDDFFFNAGGLPGETVQCRVQNTTGAPITVRSVCQIADA